MISSVLSKNGNYSYLLVVCYNVFNRCEGDDHVLFNKNKSMIIAYPASSREVWYEIPDSVVRIDDCAFRGCEKLEKVIIPDSVKELGWGLFDGCETTVTVYCDEGSAIQEYCIRNGIKEARISEKGND